MSLINYANENKYSRDLHDETWFFDRIYPRFSSTTNWFHLQIFRNSSDLVYNNIHEWVRWRIVNYERDLIVTAGFEYNGICSAIVTNVGILQFFDLIRWTIINNLQRRRAKSGIFFHE